MVYFKTERKAEGEGRQAGRKERKKETSQKYLCLAELFVYLLNSDFLHLPFTDFVQKPGVLHSRKVGQTSAPRKS